MIRNALSNLTAAVLRFEVGKNDVMEQILAQKLNRDFSVTRKTLTKCKGSSSSPFSTSRPDICVQHKEKFYNRGVVASAFVGSAILTNESEQIEGDTYSAVIEFKTGSFAIDQTVANMICVAADGSMEVLKNGKQISLAIVYGVAVNYSSATCKLLKLCLDFNNNCYEVLELKNEVTLVEGINFIVTVLAK